MIKINKEDLECVVAIVGVMILAFGVMAFAVAQL